MHNVVRFWFASLKFVMQTKNKIIMTNKLITLSLLTIPFSIYAGDNDNEQKIILSPELKDRIETNIPDVDYSEEENTLSVEFDSASQYVLTVKDQFGGTECEYPVVTDGNAYSYQLPSLKNGIYTVEISNPGNTYSGEFYVGY